tara:strand:- start:1488 stop:1808 length:321 start_codon:yes stop_codon:yes gene_type:complete
MDYKTLYIILVSLGVILIIYYFFPKGLQGNPTPPPPQITPNDYSQGTLNPLSEDQVWGCTDSNAGNYSPLATVDNGSCLTAGCSDINATNYDPSANYDPFNNLCIY